MVNMPTPIATAPKATKAALAALQFDAYELIGDMQRAVCEIWPDTTQQQLDHVAAQVRAKWEGDRPPYLDCQAVRRRQQRDQRIRSLHQQGERVQYLARHFELSERQVLRILQSPA